MSIPVIFNLSEHDHSCRFIPLPHAEQVKLTASGFSPKNCEQHLFAHIKKLLSLPEGLLNQNTHGLDHEGWGPAGAEYLKRLWIVGYKLIHFKLCLSVLPLSTYSNNHATYSN
jgi:hypothetical protein